MTVARRTDPQGALRVDSPGASTRCRGGFRGLLPSLACALAAGVACQGATPSVPLVRAAEPNAQGSATADAAAGDLPGTGGMPSVVEASTVAPAVAAPPLWEPREVDRVTPHQPIEDPSGHALDHFYAALARTDDGEAGALTRVLHLGDSSIGIDGLPHAIRKRMQSRFGDGGPGFVLPERWSANYDNRRVGWRVMHNWSFCYIAYLCRPDGHYGLGGVIFSSRANSHTQVYPVVPKSPEDDSGRLPSFISHIEVWYAAMPRSGTLRVGIDGQQAQLIAGTADSLEDRFVEIDVEPGAHEIDLRTSGAPFRMYGLVLEHPGPGVVWDSSSMIGAFTKRLSAWDAEHIKSHMARRRPDLLVLNYGGNDLRRVVSAKLSKERYMTEYRDVVQRLRAGYPEASCLINSVIDHGASGSVTVTPAHMQVIVEAQRELAAELGCAFFDTYAAMGGGGAIHRWRKRNPALAEPDLKHLNHRGRDLMGQYIFEALVAGYVDFRARAGTDASAAAGANKSAATKATTTADAPSSGDKPAAQ